MANLIKAITTGVGGISTTADASGAITFQKDSTTTATIDASGNFAATGTVTATNFIGSGAGLTGLASAQIQTQLFTAPGTWTKPSSCTQVRVTVVGGGGGGFTGYGGIGGLASAIVPVSAPVTVTVGTGGAGGTSPAGSGGTSSFGPAVSSTGGVGAGATPGAPGTGTVTVGTVLKTGNAIITPYGYLGGQADRPSGPGNPTAALAYSTSSVYMAGSYGGGPGSAPTSPTAAGGVGGAVIVEFIG